MTNAAKLTLCLSLLTTAALSLPAQTTPSEDSVQMATTEAVRRQEATERMQKKLAEAQAAEKKGQINDAARLYQDAILLFPKVQIGNEAVEAKKRLAVAGSSAARLSLAQNANDRANYAEANEHIAIGLKLDPKNPALTEFKIRCENAAKLRRGTVPSPEMLATIPAIQEEKINIATTVQNAKVLYDMGKYDEAEAQLKKVLKQEPGNKPAYHYLNLIKEGRYQNETREREAIAKSRMGDVTGGWLLANKNESLPQPNPMARTNLIYTGEGRQKIKLKLDSIRLNEVAWDLPLVEVLKNLREESKKRDPEGVGINFFINPHVDAAPTATTASGAPAPDPLYAAVAAGMPAGSLPPSAPVVAIDMATVNIKVSPPMVDLRLADILDIMTKVSDQPIKFSIEDYGIMFSPKTPEPIALHSKLFRVDPNTFIQGLASVTSLQIGSLGSSSGGGNNGGGNNGGGNRGGNNGGNNGGGNNGDSGGGDLEGASVQIAPGGGGGRNGGMGGRNGGMGGGMGMGGMGGMAGGAAGGTGGLYGPGLPMVTANINTMALHDMVRQYFTAAGVDLKIPKSVFFNDRSGLLLVRASLQDLEIIESAVEMLNRAPNELTIESKFVEITQDDSRALGFDWFLGNTTIGGGAVGVQPGTAPSYIGSPTANNPGGMFPGTAIPFVDGNGGTTLLPVAGYVPPSASDGLLTGGLRNSSGTASTPALATITGILTDPQFRVVIRALDQRSGSDTLSESKVTTLSGRQTHIAVQDMRTLVSGVNPQQTSSGGGVNLGGDSSSSASSGGSIASSITYDTTSMPFGPVLDVLPSVSADGYSIQMVLIPTITDFVGYDDPQQFVPQAQSVSAGNLGLPLVAVLPLPHILVRQVVTTCNVWDGQTVVLGGLISEAIQKIKDKVPFLGDLPLLGRFFRSESSTTQKKNLMIFITPTLIDPAGNPLHTDDEMPFSRNSFPAQPGQATAPATTAQ